MSKTAHELSSQKNLLYRDHYRRTIKGIVAMSVLSIILTVVLVGLITWTGYITSRSYKRRNRILRRVVGNNL